MRKDGTEFPVELAVTRPDLPGPPLFCGYIRDVTERRAADLALRRLADEQAALRRVATAVAAERDPGVVFGLVTEEVGRLLNAQTANMVRYEGDGMATVVGGWSDGRRQRPGRRTVRWTVRRRQHASGGRAGRCASTATRACPARLRRGCASSGSAPPSPRR